MIAADRFGRKYANWTCFEFILSSCICSVNARIRCHDPVHSSVDSGMKVGHEYWELGHEWQWMCSHSCYDTTWLHLRRVCLDVLWFSPTVVNSIHTRCCELSSSVHVCVDLPIMSRLKIFDFHFRCAHTSFVCCKHHSTNMTPLYIYDHLVNCIGWQILLCLCWCVICYDSIKPDY